MVGGTRIELVTPTMSRFRRLRLGRKNRSKQRLKSILEAPRGQSIANPIQAYCDTVVTEVTLVTELQELMQLGSEYAGGP